MTPPSISFYVPQRYFPKVLPAAAEENWSGFGWGLYAWTIQTYLRLQAIGFPCQLVSSLPSEGIVLFHRDALRAQDQPLKPKPKLLLICLKAEKKPYPYAQIHVVQNPTEVSTLKNSYYLPHWPQPGLIPRHPRRGDHFETIAYFGHINNLAPELQAPSWSQQLAALGLRWQPIVNTHHWDNISQIDNRWNDYSNIDAVVAVRSFTPGQTYPDKPATKLYNSWLAGVPALLGAESAYQAEGQAPTNYLEVTSLTELIAVITLLKDYPVWRQTLVPNGLLQGQRYLPEQLTDRWRQFLVEVAIPAWYRWCEQPHWPQLIVGVKSYFNFKKEPAKSQLQSLASN